MPTERTEVKWQKDYGTRKRNAEKYIQHTTIAFGQNQIKLEQVKIIIN